MVLFSLVSATLLYRELSTSAILFNLDLILIMYDGKPQYWLFYYMQLVFTCNF